MRTISYKLDDLKKTVIKIGYVGENRHTQVRLDCTDLFREYPDAAASMAIVSPAGQSYPKVVTVDGSTVVWDVTDSDLAAEGDGEIQLTFTEGGVVAKTADGRFTVYRSITAEGPAPDPVDDWMQEASEALEDIEAAEVNQPVIGEDGYWYTWNQEAGEYQKTDTKAEGQDGEDGHTPVLTSSKSGKTTTIYADGDQLAQIQDGQDANIDDTSTAADKVWSAAKSNTLLSAINVVKEEINTEVTEYISPYAVFENCRVYVPNENFFYSQPYSYAKVAVYQVQKNVPYTIKYFCAAGAMDACATAETYFPKPDTGYGNGVPYVDKIVATEQGYTTTTITPSKDGFMYLQIYKEDNAFKAVIRSGVQSKIDIANEKVRTVDFVVRDTAYKVESDGIVLSTKYDASNDIQYTIKKHGVNELPDFLHTYIYENTGDPAVHELNNNNRVVYGDGDWHSPHQIKAINNIDGDTTASTWFTGGSHGYENETTGVTKTARNAGIKYFADGKEVIPGAEGRAESIVIVWKNFIQASNTEKEDGTGREVLKETITMTFKDNVFYTRTEYEPLEDINCILLYGLQILYQSGENRGIRYIGATNRAEYSPSASSSCGDNSTNTMLIINKDTKMVQELTINSLVDLGKRSYCSNLTQAMFGASYGKGYATIINTQTSMAEGNIYVLEGEYRTYKKIDVAS